jgi:hypothetical protein
MNKHIATVAGVALAGLFVVSFFAGRSDPKHLTDVAPRVGMSYQELMDLGPRVASTTGVTLGSSRRVVYLLVCSGRATRETLEEQALRASTLSREQRLTSREAVTAVLAQRGDAGEPVNLKGC